MPSEKRLCIWPGEGKKSLVGVFIAAEQALGFQGVEIELIEEWPVAIGRRARPGQEDRFTIQTNHRESIRQAAPHGNPGVLVPVVRREIPKQTWFLLKIISIEDEGLSPVPVAIGFAQESNTRLFAPREAGIALLGPRDFDGGRSERRLLQHDFIARRDLHIPVAVIERFRPEE